MQVLITGADGFIGKNLALRLSELDGFNVITFLRDDTPEILSAKLKEADAVVHLAGENRPSSIKDFEVVNSGLTKILCDLISGLKLKVPVIISSSTQVGLDNPYGKSKLAAEAVIKNFADECGNPVGIYRLPGVFGKWCKPNYNSVVATFCHNIANGIPIQIDDPEHILNLVYIDDVVDSFIKWLQEPLTSHDYLQSVEKVYEVSLIHLANQIQLFADSRKNLVTENVANGFTRALYSTYVSYLPPEEFGYKIPSHSDERGTFVEMLKTKDAGQFSFFTAHPGITRGGHYHHSKTEKFLVIKGEAQFRFRHMLTNEFSTIVTSEAEHIIVETIPGWSHDITNIGSEDLVVMLWANEIFNADRPDTIPSVIK